MATDNPKEFGVCDMCGGLVYRLIGTRHGDGQVDSDDTPVWLLGDDEQLGDIDRATLPRVVCGCNEKGHS